ncbi:MAG: PaaI family thioesterase [Thermodesulfobacteriota bacterium]
MQSSENAPLDRDARPIGFLKSPHSDRKGFMDEKVKEAIFRKIEKEPFAQKFGIKLLELDEGYSRVEMKFTPDMENFLGMAHGGALFALIDEAFETASNSHGTIAVALNMNITYISPPHSDSTLIAEAREFSRTQRTAVYDIKLFDDQSNLIASCEALVYRKGTVLPFLKEEQS